MSRAVPTGIRPTDNDESIADVHLATVLTAADALQESIKSATDLQKILGGSYAQLKHTGCA